jgi:hypothetical protein
MLFRCIVMGCYVLTLIVGNGQWVWDENTILSMKLPDNVALASQMESSSCQ